MLPYSTLIPIDRESAVAVYRQIANSIIGAVRDGVIKPGTVLPGTRALSRELNVHRKTVIAAYDELYAQSWIETSERRCARVPQKLPELPARSWSDIQISGYGRSLPGSFYPLNGINYTFHDVETPRLVIDDGHCDHRLAPFAPLTQAYKDCVHRAGFKKTIAGSLASGSPVLKEALVDYFSKTRALWLSPAHLLITQGAQMALYIAAQILLKPGDAVIVAAPDYYMADYAFIQAGAKLVRVKADCNGMNMDEVEAACRGQKIKALYVIPHHHHPTTVTLSPERRMRLLEMAREYNFIIIEDDYDYEFHYSSAPYLPLASSRHEGRVIYIGSFSKSTAGSVRIGFMVAPEDFIAGATLLRRVIDLRGYHLMEEALAELITNGDFARHLKKSNKIYHQRRDLMCGALTKHLGQVAQFSKPDGGMAVWVQFNHSCRLKMLAAEAAKYKLVISSGELFNLPGRDFNATRFGFASLNPDEIEEAIELLGRLAQRKSI